MADSMVESVEQIVVEALKQQDTAAFVKYLSHAGYSAEEPDSRKVTLDILLKVLTGLGREMSDREGRDPTLPAMDADDLLSWLRSQAQETDRG